MGDTNPAHFREEMETYRRAANEEANALKDTHLALERLRTLYQKFDAEERTMAEQVLAEWALSEDENVRFDALALIDDFRISAATPVLRLLLERLSSSSAPGAPY